MVRNVHPLMLLLLGIAYTLGSDIAFSQTSPEARKHVVTVSVGIEAPVSKENFTKFWKPGVGGTVAFHALLSRSVALGVGIDYTRLPFDEQGFKHEFHDVPVQAKNLSLGSIYLIGKLMMLPRMRTCPFLSAIVGTTIISEAVYQRTVLGVKRTYYNVHGSTRLTVGLSTGVDIYINRMLSLEFDARGMYLHNDPSLKMYFVGRGGMRFIL